MSLDRHPLRAMRKLTAEQEPFLAARSFATTYPAGYRMQEHRHDWHQFLYAVSGSMTLMGERTSWMVPPGRGVLIPARVHHSMRMWGSVAMRSLYFPEATRGFGEDCKVVSVTGLLHELILRTVELAGLDSRVDYERDLAAVLLHEIASAPEGPLSLPMPGDARALKAAQALLEDPANSWTVGELAKECGLSSRTLERLFVKQTGMRFGTWRQKAKLLESLRLLVEEDSVTEAALGCGYSSVSAYIAAFGQVFGCTPGAMRIGKLR